MPCDLQRMQTANLALVTTFIVLNILYNYGPVDLALVQGLVIAGSAIAD